MLKKTNRLSSVRLKKPNQTKNIYLNIKFTSNKLSYSRFGFVISKKLDKRAVVRNNVKRKLSKSVEEIFDRIEGGRDFVFYPKVEVIKTDQEKLNEEMRKLFEKEGFLNV